MSLNLLLMAPFLPDQDWEIWAPHTWAPWLSMRLFRGALILLGAFVLIRLWYAVLTRLEATALKRDPSGGVDLERRLDTLVTVARRIGAITLYLAAFLVLLADFGIQIVPLVAGLGIVGVAVGFGAQYMVRDLINGFFLVAEDQFRVGDSVKIGEFTGTVETMSLRTTRIRALGGEVHTLPNGEIRTVTNFSRDWSRAIVDAVVARGAQLEAAFEALREAGRRASSQKEILDLLLQPPEVVGVTELSDSGVTVRLWAKVHAGRQVEAERALRLAVTQVLAERGIALPVPARRVSFDGPGIEALRGGGGGG